VTVKPHSDRRWDLIWLSSFGSWAQYRHATRRGVDTSVLLHRHCLTVTVPCRAQV